MKIDELITEAIKEFLDVEIHGDTGELDFLSKIIIVRRRIMDRVKSSPDSYGLTTNEYEYEMFFSSNPNDMIKIDGWMPIDTTKIEKADKIDEYMKIGLLRKIERSTAA